MYLFIISSSHAYSIGHVWLDILLVSLLKKMLILDNKKRIRKAIAQSTGVSPVFTVCHNVISLIYSLFQYIISAYY